jgi:glycosyltransferase involved in cell wall biosynthesis
VIADATPTVSIVITCYNQGRYLADAIRSALGQCADWRCNPIEVVVVDDGSTDRTRSVAAGFPQIRYLFQQNQGLSAARNSGLAASRGQYVCFLDADDVLLPEAIEAGLNAFNQQPLCAFVYGDFLDVDEQCVPLSTPRGPRVAREHYRAFLEGNFIGMHATVLYRSDALRCAGGFDVRLRRCEDYEVYLRLARQFEVREHGAIVAHYRQHAANMSLDHAAMLRAALAVLKLQRPHVRPDADLRRALRLGMANWREYYGGFLFAEVKWQRHAFGLSWKTCRSLWTLAGLLPRAVIARGIGMGRSRLRKMILDPLMVFRT